MSRIGVTVVAIAAVALTLAMQAAAATAPGQAPVLTSPLFASPVAIHWTPPVVTTADDGRGEEHGKGEDEGEGKGENEGEGKGHGKENGDTVTLYSVLRAQGPCGTAAAARAVATFTDPAASNFSDPVAAGTYCYSIGATDDSTAAVSPGLTVVVGTQAVAAVAIASAAPLAVPSAAVPAVSSSVVRDTAAPPSPAKLGISFARRVAARVPVTVRWRNPAVPDLDRVELVLNGKHPPKNMADGRVVYRGLGQSSVLALRAGQTAHLALYAVDRSGNISPASRRVISLAAFLPMRPLTGSAVQTAPVLRWEPRKGVAYYNVQVFHQGKRVLVAWPQRPSYRVPAAKLEPGTYVWFVWPALARTHASPRFDDLIGRATFTYVR